MVGISCTVQRVIWEAPCRVVGEFDGRYQLYCSKGVLSTTFSRAEVLPMARCTPIPMASDSAIIEPCNCQMTQTSFQCLRRKVRPQKCG